MGVQSSECWSREPSFAGRLWPRDVRRPWYASPMAGGAGLRRSVDAPSQGAPPSRVGEAASAASARAMQGADAWARYERVRVVVRRVVDSLGAETIVAPMKGAWLVATGTRHPADRAMRDVDLLIAGTSLARVTDRLARDGFRLADVPRAYGVVSLAPREATWPWVDLHTRPLPPGLGRLDARAMLAGARLDREAYGVPVRLVADLPAAIQLVGNLLKDRVVHAHAEAGRDLEAVLAGGRLEPEVLAGGLVEAGLGGGGALVCAWAAQGGADLTDLATALEARGFAKHVARACLRRAIDREGGSPALARLASRLVADHATDRILAVGAAAVGALTHPLRVATFTARLGR